jgi:methionyl-tRNA formyltransferase
MIRIAFMGTPEFAVPSLAALYDAGYELCVFTQQDKPAGRGGRLTAPPVKVFASEKGIPVYQPRLVRLPEGVEVLKQFNPDYIVTAAFGQILPVEVLNIPRKGCINVHASLLPEYRGAAPIQWAIINGEKETGVTTMMTDAGLDTGDMLLKCTEPIMRDDTAQTLFERLAHKGAQLLIETIKELENNSIVPVRQNEEQSSYYPMIKKSMALMDFNKTADQLDCFVRGMYSWPIAYFDIEEGTFKVHKAHAEQGQAAPGEIIYADAQHGLAIGCKKGFLVIDMLQAPGGKVMKAADYLRGHKVRVGQFAGHGGSDD